MGARAGRREPRRGLRDRAGRWEPRRALGALLAAAALATAAAGCGGGDDDDGGSRHVPSGAVATVGDVEISGEELDTQVDALVRVQRRAGSPASGGASGGGGDEATEQLREQLESQALSMLLMREALEQEAADRNIEVSDEEFRERWDVAAKGQFKTEKALKRFLGGQTEQNVLDQLRLQVLTERIHQQVAEEAGGGKDGAKAVKQFQKDFQQRLRDRTACADGYTAAGCADASSN